ncbi:hypothetical protein BN946_scf185042.g133 [Trametes cinnabarina]|uniref:F-box domain-containing protein n=1 Tax=Pycnoporus cinnabarinus TaxID=5643 RepID=A0A060S4X2_PYCCI|nr:hypothetical protein BN946_scf185042.g133 [Trametes cinnabarina]
MRFMWLIRKRKAAVARVSMTDTTYGGDGDGGSSRLRRLDDDVLLQIYEELRPDEGLRPLSLTCKWVRESVKPVLFTSVYQAAESVTWEQFIPRHLWPYIQKVCFLGVWLPWGPARDDRHYRPSEVLRDALSEMPRLTAIYIASMEDSGVPWEVQDVILSRPSLRVFEVTERLYTDKPSNVPSFTAAPLTCYRQVIEDFRKPEHRYSAADSLLLCVLLGQQQVQASIETLEAPILLRGEDWDHSKPLVHLFGQMPALQELVLTVGHRDGSELMRLCPLGWAGPLPWPELKTLIMSHPDPDDLLYSSLPGTLRHLALRCWPRHYFFQLYATRMILDDYRWSSPILSFAAMAKILRQCQSDRLDKLEIEFTGDQADIDLFRLISHAFPNLSTLMIYRYRPRSVDSEVPVVEIGKALEPLSRLRYLYLHLDFPEAPHPLFDHFLPSSVLDMQHVRMMRVFEQSARRIVRCIGPSLAIVSFLSRGPSENTWIPYRVERIGNGRIVMLDTHALNERGLVSSDDKTPPPPALF